LIDPSYGAYFRTEADDDAEGSTRKRKRKTRVLGAPSGDDWETARYGKLILLVHYIII